MMCKESLDITLYLELAKKDSAAMAKLFQAVQTRFKEIAWREISKETGYHTLQATCLSTDAFLQLMEARKVKWENREQFFGAACTVMQRILIDHYRHRATIYQGGVLEEGKRKRPPRIVLDDVLDMKLDDLLDDPQEFVAFHELLERLASEQPEAFLVLDLHVYMGCELKQIAEQLPDVSYSTVKRRWSYAVSYLHKAWTGEETRDV